ncbi:uncharacterized protein LOC108942575 [Scleropages formosus]|uniref:uncharacterized protein LOC108942575 n=1 Tax=Scleropages formosus TaxID=113540 RepID=UPI0010FA9052|nr:uncharacterized protein LOC108942575 [Scleropages formosus]
MSQKRRRGSMVFRWHKSLAILVPWKKGKGDMVLDSEVVLTKMKLFDNFHGRLCGAEDSVSTISISVSEQDLSEPGQVSDGDPNLCPSEQAPSDPKPDYLSVFSDPQLPRLYKFESEDSGVEMPSGADSPSTPTGSEQSFVVHSRAPSRDSQDLGTDVAAPGPILQTEKCPATEETKTPLHPVTKEEGNDFGTLETKTNLEVMQVHISPMEENMTMKGPQDGLLEDTSEDCENSIVMKVATEELAEQSTTIRNCNSTEALNMTEADLQPQPLRKSTTSDSLDEYMEECCRLSEVHRAKINPLGPSLGYLEHICQLIEKIGQLQEHNLRLQRQLSSLQKENRTKNTKEEFFLQQCCCGAASLTFQETKLHSRSDFSSLTASNSALSDLSTIPEVTQQTGKAAATEGESRWYPLVSLRRKALNRRSYTEGESRYLCESSEGFSATYRRLSEIQHPWVRMKELVKKTRLRNQSSCSLKSSCPQLYRPDLGPVELPRRDRNSMIALGHQTKLDFLWQQ